MVLTFYNTDSPSIKLNKDLGSPVGSTNAAPNPTGEVDVINPVFILNYNVPASANYVVAGAPLNRSYFITDISYTIAKTCVVTCHVDVLGTNANKINNATLNFIRGAEDINEIEDTSYPVADTLKPTLHYSFSNWASSFFTNSDSGRRYLLRVADGRSASWQQGLRELQIGDQIVYKNLGFTLLGTYNGAYLSEPTEIPLPEPAGYYRVADGSQFTIYTESGGTYLSQDYQFQERESYGAPAQYYLLTVND